jgi:dienelactone hydrolase
MARLYLIFVLIVALPWSAVASSAAADVGVILMHGKGETPPTAISGLANVLRSKGFIVATPEMPWSGKRQYDVDYPAALNEIEAAANSLQSKGASRIIVAGFSFGANGALAYAASGRQVDGVMAIAPGHVPDLRGFQAKVAKSVQKARQMIAEGKGDSTASFDDINQGRSDSVRATAHAYLSYFDPAGQASMPRSAQHMPRAVPFLWVIGDKDRLLRQGQEYVYDKFPRHPKSRYLVVSAGHGNTPSVATGEIVEWLTSLGY